MDPRRDKAVTHLRTAGNALADWWRAATLDALIVGVLWLIGLELIRVPFAPLWAILGGLLQIITTVGGNRLCFSIAAAGTPLTGTGFRHPICTESLPAGRGAATPAG